MAIFIYQKKIDDLRNHATDPADFVNHLYQPDSDPNGKRVHHCKDHNHLLKPVCSRLCEGYIHGLDLRHLDALHDPSTGLGIQVMSKSSKHCITGTKP